MKMEIVFEGVKKSVNFTDPQAAIMRRLLQGERATFINTHWMSGGEFVWYDKDGNYWGKESVGYKAFNGAMRTITKVFSLNREAENRLYSQFIVQ